MSGQAEIIRVALIEPRGLLLEGYSRLIGAFKKVRTVMLETSATTVLERMKREKVDVIISDIETEDLDVIQLMSRLKNDFPLVRLIVSGAFHPGTLIIPLLRHGISTYYLKDSVGAVQLEAIIKDVYEQNFSFTDVVTPEVIKKTWRYVDNSNLPEFSAREEDVLILLVQGYSKLDIASKLFISESTVKYHIQNLTSKTGTSSTLELVLKAVNSNWVSILLWNRKYIGNAG